MSKNQTVRPRRPRGQPRIIEGDWAVCRMPENDYNALKVIAARSHLRVWQVLRTALDNSFGLDWREQSRCAKDVRGQELLFQE